MSEMPKNIPSGPDAVQEKLEYQDLLVEMERQQQLELKEKAVREKLLLLVSRSSSKSWAPNLKPSREEIEDNDIFLRVDELRQEWSEISSQQEGLMDVREELKKRTSGLSLDQIKDFGNSLWTLNAVALKEMIDDIIRIKKTNQLLNKLLEDGIPESEFGGMSGIYIEQLKERYGNSWSKDKRLEQRIEIVKALLSAIQYETKDFGDDAQEHISNVGAQRNEDGSFTYKAYFKSDTRDRDDGSLIKNENGSSYFFPNARIDSTVLLATGLPMCSLVRTDSFFSPASGRSWNKQKRGFFDGRHYVMGEGLEVGIQQIEGSDYKGVDGDGGVIYECSDGKLRFGDRIIEKAKMSRTKRGVFIPEHIELSKDKS